MTVQSILKDKGTKIVTITSDTTMAKAARLMIAERIGAVLVMSSADKIEGILSERDIVRAFAGDGTTIADQTVAAFMTRDVYTCGLGDTVDRLMEVMTEQRIRHIPVIDQGRLAGIISIGDVVKRRIRDAQVEVDSLRDYVFSNH